MSATETKKRAPRETASLETKSPWQFKGGVDEVHLNITGEQVLPEGHSSGNVRLSVNVTLEHVTDCLMEVKFREVSEYKEGSFYKKEGKIQIEPESLPLLVATLTEAARQFESRGLRNLVMVHYT